MEKDHQEQNMTAARMLGELGSIQKLLLGQCHELELLGMYVCISIVLGVCVLIVVALLFLRNSLVKYMLKLQLRNAPRNRPVRDMEIQNSRRKEENEAFIQAEDFEMQCKQGARSRQPRGEFVDVHYRKSRVQRNCTARPHTIHVTDRE